MFLFLALIASIGTSAQTDYIVTEYDSATILPPDTAAVISGVRGDSAFFVDADTALAPKPFFLKGSLPYAPNDPSHHVYPAEWIVPGSAAVVSAICVNSFWGKKWRHWVQDRASQKGYRQVWADDYMQWSPIVAAYGLDLLGVKAQHRVVDRTIILAMSAMTMGVVVKVAKKAFKEMRPDSSKDNSFPSGHTATSFMGAEFLWQEYRSTHPWIGCTGYAIAFGVGYLRVHNHRHWVNDVLGGAAVGMLSTKFAYWLYPKIFKERSRKYCPERRGKSFTMFGMPYLGDGAAGVNVAMTF